MPTINTNKAVFFEENGSLFALYVVNTNKKTKEKCYST